MKTAKFVMEITVKDPDTKGKVQLEVYKHENGGMFAIDGSFLEATVNLDDFDRPIIPDPFSDDKGEVVLFD
jgi:hypothetical protein